VIWPGTPIIPQVESVTERNKRKVWLFMEAVLNEGRLELIEELVAADFVGHMPGLSSPVVGPAELRRLVSQVRGSYADLYIKIEDQIAEDDRVVVRWRATATSAGEPSNTSEQACRCTGVSIVRFLAGKQVDVRVECPAVAFEWIGVEAYDPQRRSPA
jgi:hypothetical protein